MTHDETHELLGAFALDAVEAHQHDLIEAHLAKCPRCRSDVDGFREVAAALGTSVEPVPEDLWYKISSRLPEKFDDSSPRMPTLLHVHTHDLAPRENHRPRRRQGSHRWAVATGAVVSAAAVAAVVALGIGHGDSQGDGGQALGRSATSDVVSALETPGHQVVNLNAPDHAQLAQFVVANGRGFLVSSKLPALSSGETYQLWGVVANQPISLGLLGRSPSHSVFTLAGDSSPTLLGVTVEPAGGSVVPTSPMLAAGTI